jgi:hypothetical protein
MNLALPQGRLGEAPLPPTDLTGDGQGWSGLSWRSFILGTVLAQAAPAECHYLQVTLPEVDPPKCLERLSPYVILWIP